MELGKIMGVSQQTINKYETGKTEPDFHMLKTLAEFFHTSIDYLVGYTDNPNSYRVVSDVPALNDSLFSPYRRDKMKKGMTASAQLLREIPAIESPGLFNTTPKECHHLAMYRKLTAQMQIHLDSLLECIAPDNSYTDFRKPDR